MAARKAVVEPLISRLGSALYFSNNFTNLTFSDTTILQLSQASYVFPKI